MPSTFDALSPTDAVLVIALGVFIGRAAWGLVAGFGRLVWSAIESQM